MPAGEQPVRIAGVWVEAHEVLHDGDPLRVSIRPSPEQAVMRGDEDKGSILPIDGKAVDMGVLSELGHWDRLRPGS